MKKCSQNVVRSAEAIDFTACADVVPPSAVIFRTACKWLFFHGLTLNKR